MASQPRGAAASGSAGAGGGEHSGGVTGAPSDKAELIRLFKAKKWSPEAEAGSKELEKIATTEAEQVLGNYAARGRVIREVWPLLLVLPKEHGFTATSIWLAGNGIDDNLFRRSVKASYAVRFPEVVQGLDKAKGAGGVTGLLVAGAGRGGVVAAAGKAPP